MSEYLAENVFMPDPWMVEFKEMNKYILTFTSNGAGQIELWSSPYLQSFDPANATTSSRVIWYDPSWFHINSSQDAGD
jgi:hypothetical protein